MTKKRWVVPGIVLSIVAVITALILYWILHGICTAGTPQFVLEGSVKQDWIAHYSCQGDAQEIAVDQQGNIYVTGGGDDSSYFGLDYVTIKYNRQGKELWVARYPGSYASSIAVDANGSVYVAGTRCTRSIDQNNSSYELAVVKYDTDGNELWTARHSFDYLYYGVITSIALDKQDNVYVTIDTGEYADSTICTLKYNGINGTELWAVSHNASRERRDYPSIVVDDSGCVYVGNIKYDHDGHELWVIDTENEECDSGCSIVALDTQGNICMATGNYLVAKYDADGKQIWVAYYNNSTQGYGQPRAIAVDSLGDIYVVGELATVKYSSDGALVWEGSGGRALAVDRLGNAYVTGRDETDIAFYSGADTEEYMSFYTIKYNSNGSNVWTARYWGGLYRDEPRGIAVDESGNVYVIGKSYTERCYSPKYLDVDHVENSDYIIIKYSQQ